MDFFVSVSFDEWLIVVTWKGINHNYGTKQLTAHSGVKTILKEYSHIFIPLCFHKILIKNPENLTLTKVVLMDKFCADSYAVTVVTKESTEIYLNWLLIKTKVKYLAKKDIINKITFFWGKIFIKVSIK